MENKYDIITFGSASRDIYLISKKFIAGRDIQIAVGTKTELADLFFASGGGGTNAAATFANQRLKVAYCGQLGQDYFGNLIVKELKKLRIGTDLIKKTRSKSTNLSVFLAFPGQDITILVYRGASDLLSRKNIPWPKIKNTRWFYLAPFSGQLAKLTEDLVNFAKKNKIKVALNPGYNQLTLPKPVLKRILNKIDVLILNREEASLLTKIPYHVDEVPLSSSPLLRKRSSAKEKEIFKKIDKMTNGIAIMTKGGQGVVVSDGKYLYRAPSLYLKIVNSGGLKFIDGTGAGDAFGAGFVAGMIQKDDIVFAIQLAMANSGYVTTKWGAKEGLLKKGQKWPKIKVTKEPCSEHDLC